MATDPNRGPGGRFTSGNTASRTPRGKGRDAKRAERMRAQRRAREEAERDNPEDALWVDEARLQDFEDNPAPNAPAGTDSHGDREPEPDPRAAIPPEVDYDPAIDTLKPPDPLTGVVLPVGVVPDHRGGFVSASAKN